MNISEIRNVANRANALANNDRQIIHLIEKQVHQELIIEFTPRITDPPRTKIIKQQSSSPILWNDSSRPLPKIIPHPIREKLETSASKKKRTTSKSNSKSSGEVKKKPFFFIRPKAERTNAQQTDMSKLKQRISVSSAARQDTGKKIVQTQEISPATCSVSITYRC